MQSKRRIYGRNAETMSHSPTNRSEAAKTPKNDRSLPYKLLRFPPSKTALWNHSSIGNKETLQFVNYVPKLVLTKDMLRFGHRLVTSSEEDVNGDLNGIVTFDKQLQQLVIRIGGKIITSTSSVEMVSNTKLQFSKDSRNRRRPRNEEIFSEAAQMLRTAARTKEPISIGRFVYTKMFCFYERNVGSVVNIDLWTDVVTFGSIFDAYLIEPLSIIPTALSKGLSDPNGNTFLHGEPKTGYLTMDELRRLLLVLDTDPKVSSLPLVGIWVSGIESIHNPFVWAACNRYISCNVITERVCQPPDPFLIVFYDKRTFRPQFYDCIYTNRSANELVFHSGKISSTIDFYNSGDEIVEVFLQKSQREPSELEISKVVETPCQKLLFTPQAAALDQPGPSSLRLLRIQTGTSPSLGILQKPSKETESEKCSSPTNVMTDSRSRNSIGSKSFESNDNGGCSVPIPLEIYQLLEAQEQQLKLLKQQVDELVRERSESTSSPRSVVTNALEMASCKQSAKSTKALTSMATMTSFVWPPPSNTSGCSKCSKSESNTDSLCRDEPTVGSRTHSDTVELVRRENVDSKLSLSKIEDSLGNLQLATFSELPDTPRSSFLVDLQDFQESFASSANSDESPRPILFERGDSVQFSISEHNSNNVYDNLLRRIQTVLSRQSPENQRDERSNRYRSPNKPVFDSLFLPRLNYISLQLSSIDTDQSAEFGALARKYLCTRNASSPTSDTELSLATMQYLRKYRL